MFGMLTEIISLGGLGCCLAYLTLGDHWYWAAGAAAANLITGAAEAFQHATLAAALSGAVGMAWLLITWIDWKNRNSRKRKRLLAWLGHKARVKLGEMIRKMPRPRRLPRLQPVRG